jgi:signal transduction histidine kinase
MKCPRCQQDNATAQKFCGECGTPLSAVSPTDPPAPSYAEVTTALSEALEQQTATTEILRVIASSPTDVQPVFDTILASATTLLGGFVASITRRVGDDVHMAAFTSMGESLDATVRQSYPVSIDSPNPHSMAIRRCEPHIIADADTQPDIPEPVRRMARARGWRSNLAVPLRRSGTAIGALGVSRRDARGFTPAEVALLQTFADQAVIAIENVRLFTELQEKNRALTQAHAQVTETLEQQTATAEILRVISSSPTDVQPVFDAIVRSAARLCHAYNAAVFRTDGRTIEHPANYGAPPDAYAEVVRQYYPMPLTRWTQQGQAMIDRSVVYLEDSEAPSTPPLLRNAARRLRFRSQVTTPMLRDDEPVGAITVTRAEPGRFTDAEIALLQTFADQAVIAIENVRLFTELQEKNRALTKAHAQATEALEQQTATSDILRVINQSPTDVQPVFDAIVRNGVRLCDGLFGSVYRFDGERIHLVANYNFTPEQLAHYHRTYPRVLSDPGDPVTVIRTGRVLHIPDVEIHPGFLASPPDVRENLRWRGIRSAIGVPMLRQDQVIGAIFVSHRGVDAFTDEHVELLKTFAHQAVIAVENVRLFKELEAQTAALTRSVDQLTALGEVGRAVSSTLDLATVLTTIVSRAVELSGLDGGVVLEYNEGEQEFVQRAQAETGGPLAGARRGTRIRRGEGVVGRTAMTLEPVQVPDITAPGAYVGPNRENLIESGVRAILAVPMVREGQLIGCLGVTRNQPGEFPRETIELLRTFGAQSALAIQNARLFQEIEEKSRQLEAASQHKSEFLANMSHELRTPLNAIIGFSEVLGERLFGELNEKQEEYLKDIHASGQHLLSLINDILDLSKIEAGRMELELTDFDLPTAIDNALTLVRERASRRGIALHQAAHEGLGQIRGDERKIKQVLLNLLSNAIKFTPDGGRIEVRATPVDGSVEVTVSDTGVGIAPEDQEAIFEEFRQVGTAHKKVEGTGLGLALSRKFVELHGGRIWVQSEVGVGSAFRFKIPTRQER